MRCVSLLCHSINKNNLNICLPDSVFQHDADLFCRLLIQTKHRGPTIKTCCSCGCDQSDKVCIAEQPHVILCSSRPGLSMSIQFANKCHNDTADNYIWIHSEINVTSFDTNAAEKNEARQDRQEKTCIVERFSMQNVSVSG